MKTASIAQTILKDDIDIPTHDAAGGFNGHWIGGSAVDAVSPIDGEVFGTFCPVESVEDYDSITDNAVSAFQTWRKIPAPRRGEIVRQLGNEFRIHKKALGQLIAIETGKLLTEGLGEVQEVIDICDFAVGLSRQLYGRTMPSERQGHTLRETWHPLGPVAVITAWNFPAAVWAWNAAIAAVCGNSVVWKPSSRAPFTAIACTTIAARVCQANKVPSVFSLMCCDRNIGQGILDDPRFPLVSATGSTRMGRDVAVRVARRFGSTILELGGNNAAIVAPSADLDMAVRAVTFGAVGTAGQRCTTTRRAIVHESVYDEFVTRMLKAYGSLSVGIPLAAGVDVGPLISEEAIRDMRDAIRQARGEGKRVLTDGIQWALPAAGYYAAPEIVAVDGNDGIVKQETFAPILYIMPYKTFAEAIELNNGVPQGLSSAVFTTDMREAELFLSALGSDCGLANVNTGTSGAEIGGAFGGEKETGGGRESGSDAWKGYMRRQTSTINFSESLPLAQGVEFGD